MKLCEPRHFFRAVGPVAAIWLSIWTFRTHAAAIPSRLDHVDTLLRNGNYSEAEKVARALLPQAETTHGVDSKEVADVLDRLVVAVWRTGKAGAPESRGFAVRAVQIREARPGGNAPDIARSLTNLGLISITAGRYSDAAEPLARAVAICDRVPSPDSLVLARALLWRGALGLAVDDPDAAEPTIQRSLDIRLLSLPPDDPDIAESLNALASAQYYSGNFAGAITTYERALGVWTRAFGSQHPAVATGNHNLGATLCEIGDYQEAKGHLEAALQVRRTVLASDHPLVAFTMTALARALQGLGERVAALKLYREAIRIGERAYGRVNPDTGWRLSQMGLLLIEEGNYLAAGQALREALAIQEETLGSDHADLAWTLVGLAKVDENNGVHSTLVISLYERAISILEGTYGPTGPDVGLKLSEYAAYLARSGRAERALEVSLRAAEIGREHQRLSARGFAERQALAYTATRAYGLDVALSQLKGELDRDTSSVRRVWDALVRSRTMVLDEMAIRQRTVVEASGDSAVAAAAAGLESARYRLARLMVRGAGDSSAARFQAMLLDARAVVERAERQLASLSAAYRRSRLTSAVGLGEVERALRAGSVLVSYVAYGGTSTGRHYVAFALAPGLPPGTTRLGGGTEIDSLVSAWVGQMYMAVDGTGPRAAYAESTCRAHGDRLRRRIWDPIAREFPDAKVVYIVPDGSLYRVSFAALPVRKSYLVEAGPVIHYLSSERDLVLGERGEQPWAGLLALGGPAFDAKPWASLIPSTPEDVSSGTGGSAGNTASAKRGAEPNCSDFSTAHFVPLPESAAEVEEIGRLWVTLEGGAKVLTGTGATEWAFKRQAPGRRVLHLATHGFFLADRCATERPGARGIGGVKSQPGPRPAPMRHPVPGLLLSGLALAGANHRDQARMGQEDGILTAQEIASLDLSSVDWAVLSACETGVGEVQVGEGVLGLRRAFQMAGARTVIMSLWAVGDRATRIWMKALYEAKLRRGFGAAEAVHSASLSALRERRAQSRSTHPTFWAGFVAAGDWN